MVVWAQAAVSSVPSSIFLANWERQKELQRDARFLQVMNDNVQLIFAEWAAEVSEHFNMPLLKLLSYSFLLNQIHAHDEGIQEVSLLRTWLDFAFNVLQQVKVW